MIGHSQVKEIHVSESNQIPTNPINSPLMKFMKFIKN